MRDRVERIVFSNSTGNRLGIVAYAMSAAVVCPLDWRRQVLLDCIGSIEYTEGSTNTGAAIRTAQPPHLPYP